MIFTCYGHVCQHNRSHTNEIKYDNASVVYGVLFEESFIKCGKCLNLYSKALIEKSSNILWRGRVILKWVPEITACRVVALDIRTGFPSLYLDVVIVPLFHQYQKREIRTFVFVRLLGS